MRPIDGMGATAALDALARHWPELLMEAWGLGLFMLSAGVFATLLEAPGARARRAIPSPLARRALMGLAMGATALVIFLSPWGARSGAQINPAVTLTYWTLGRMGGWVALGYGTFQLLGGLAGVLLARLLLRRHFADAPVSFVATVPGAGGRAVAFVAELAMSFSIMSLVLHGSAHAAWRPHVPALVAGALALFITLLAPVSGVSLNPARTLASAIPSGITSGLWIYLTAPVAGMLLAAALDALIARAASTGT